MSEIALTHQASPGAAASVQRWLGAAPGAGGGPLADAATIEVDARHAHRVKLSVTLEGNRFLTNSSNLVDGARLSFVVRQDSGGRTLAYGNKFKWPRGTVPMLSTTPGRVDLIDALYDAAGNELLCRFAPDIR